MAAAKGPQPELIRERQRDERERSSRESGKAVGQRTVCGHFTPHARPVWLVQAGFNACA